MLRIVVSTSFFLVTCNVAKLAKYFYRYNNTLPDTSLHTFQQAMLAGALFWVTSVRVVYSIGGQSHFCAEPNAVATCGVNS